MNTAHDPDRLLTTKQLAELYGLPYSRCHLWRLARVGKFPAPVRLGANRIAYRESEIRAWVASRPRAHASGVLDSKGNDERG